MRPPKSKSSTAKPKAKSWNDLCGAKTVTAEKKKLSAILDSFGTNGTSARTTISDMVKKLNDLTSKMALQRREDAALEFHFILPNTQKPARKRRQIYLLAPHFSKINLSTF